MEVNSPHLTSLINHYQQTMFMKYHKSINLTILLKQKFTQLKFL